MLRSSLKQKKKKNESKAEEIGEVSTFPERELPCTLLWE